MLKHAKTISFLFVTLTCYLSSQIQVIYTSAVLPKQYDLRKTEYLDSFNKLKSFGLNPWIVESTNITESFFDEISNQVLYPQKNDFSLLNKGVNEARSIRESIPFMPFDDEDIVIKLTGRYLLRDRSFIDRILNTSSEFDAFASYGKHFVSPEHIFTGCFAMRWKYFKKMLNEMDFDAMEKQLIPIERVVADFIEENHIKTAHIRNLHVLARIYYSGDEIYQPLDF